MRLCGISSILALSSCGLALSRDGQYTIMPSDLIATSAIRDTLISNQIITDVLDDFEPTYYVDIAYPEAHERVLLGNDIPVDSVSDRPTFTFHKITASPDAGAKDSTFTLILTDPDAKSRAKPKMSEMCHWIMTNLTTPIPEPPPMHASKEGELMEYLPPSPPPKTGPHRYIFVLLEGDTTDIKAPADRPHWGYGKKRHGVRDWADENGLTVVGANFFFAQNKKQ